jgi:hypothetical protein
MHAISKRTIRSASLIATVLLACVATFGQANSSPEGSDKPAARSSSLPQDKHEGLSVSADSYTESGRAKERFGKANPLPVGILPVEIFLRNETLQPIRLNLETVQLVVHFQGGHDQEIDWLAVEDVAGAIAHPGGPPVPKQRRFPIGIPSSSDSKTDKIAAILKPFLLDADILPPMSTVHGFLFFDLSRDMSLAGNATLYVPDVKNIPTSKQLMFFEVPLGK